MLDRGLDQFQRLMLARIKYADPSASVLPHHQAPQAWFLAPQPDVKNGQGAREMLIKQKGTIISPLAKTKTDWEKPFR
jgi:hypothetical protein